MSDVDVLPSPISDPALARMEGALLEAGTELSRVLVRSRRRRVTAAQYGEVVEWMTHLAVSRGLSHATAANYLEAVTEYLEWLNDGQRAPEAVSAADIDRWQQELFVRDRQRAMTRHVKIVAVRRWYAWREQYHGERNPARMVQGPKREHRMPRKYSRSQLRAMLAKCDRDTVKGRRDYALLLFVLGTGARRMEVGGLTLQQLALSERVGHARFFGKGAKERVVSFEGVVLDALRAWLADRETVRPADEHAVFISLTGPSRGQPLSSRGLDWMIGRAIRRSGIRVERGMALHTLRVTYATALYDGGHDLEEIRILMGHESIETTRRYIAISERQLKVKVPREFLADVTGEENKNGTALWIRRALGE